MTGIRRICWLILATIVGFYFAAIVFAALHGDPHHGEEDLQEIYTCFFGALAGLALGIAVDHIFDFRNRLK